MQKQTDIGIIGKGFVGNAIFQGLNHYYNVKTYDVDDCTDWLEERGINIEDYK